MSDTEDTPEVQQQPDTAAANKPAGSDDIPEVNGANTLNQLVRDINRITNRWEQIQSEVQKKKTATLFWAGLEKTPGSNFQHVIFGMFISAMTDSDLSVDELKKIIKVKEEAPFFEIKATEQVQKFEKLIECLPAWILEYPGAIKESAKLTPDLIKLLAGASDAAKNAPSEFMNMEFMAKAKMIKETLQTVSKIKDRVEKVKDEVCTLSTDIQLVKSTMEKLKSEIESEEISAYAKKCKAANKTSLKDCYECAFEPIKVNKGQGSGGAKGCCTIF